MSIKINLLPGAAERETACLGLHLGTREVGIAVVAGEDLLHYQVKNIRKIPSQDGKQRSFEQLIEHLSDHHAIGLIALIAEPEERTPSRVVSFQRIWMSAYAKERGIRIAEYHAPAIKDALIPSGFKRSNRELAAELARRFPELRSKARGGQPGDAAAACEEFKVTLGGLRTAEERYWQSMFLALGCAVLHLQESQRTSFSL